MEDGTRTTAYTYDAVSRLTQLDFPDGGGSARVVAYTYSNAGNRATMTYPSGSDQVTYGYRESNNLIFVIHVEVIRTAEVEAIGRTAR